MTYDQVPAPLARLAHIYFQRFSIETIRNYNNSPPHSETEWLARIRSKYKYLMGDLDLPIPSWTEVNNLARIQTKTSDPSQRSQLRAFITICETLLSTKLQPEDQKMSSPNTQLYIVKNSNQYVTRIGTNSENLAVVEEKATGKIFAVDPKELDKVLPYTVSVKFMTSSTIYHYLTQKNQVKEGDLLFGKDASHFAQVIKIDSKNENATTQLSDTFQGVIVVNKFEKTA